MYNQPEDIIGQYDLTVRQITKGRGNGYICETDRGMKVLMPYAASAERAQFLRDFLIYLSEAGFSCEQIWLTRKGEVFSEDAYGTKYICKDLMPGNECITRSREEMKEAAKILALFHKLSAGCSLEVPDGVNVAALRLDETFRKHSTEMRRVRNFISSGKHKGAFELRFLECYLRFAAQARQAEELLEQMEVWPEQIWVHGEVNQHNVRKSASGWYMVNFEHLTSSWAMSDLAHFLRKMMEKNNWRMELGQELIRAYDSVERMGTADRELLYVLLCYPEKFWKLANRYAASHKPWLTGQSLEKLERLLAQEEARSRFLEDLRYGDFYRRQ